MSEIGQMIQTSVLVVIASIYLTGNISDRKKNETRDEKFNQSLILLAKPTGSNETTCGMV